ncbi:MAG: GNAT family N-acetyltransferase [Actinomycetes bacterium]
MGSLVLRPANTIDAYEIARIHVKTWQSAYLGMIPDSYLQNLDVDQRARNWVQILESSIEGNQTIVAEIDGAIVGFIGVGPSREPTSFNLGEVHAIYVDPNNQNFGVGSNLLKEGIRILKDQEFRGAMLWVLDQNSQTRTWYESRGWKSNGKSKKDKIKDFEIVQIQYEIDF